MNTTVELKVAAEMQRQFVEILRPALAEIKATNSYGGLTREDRVFC